MQTLKTQLKLSPYFWGLFVAALSLSPSVLYAQFSFTSSSTNVNCSGDSTGSASVSVSGGTAPYTYLWLGNGQINDTITGLAAGDYSVTVTDNSGYDSTISLIVSEPVPIMDSAVVTLPVCSTNGSIMLALSGGTAPYGYLWNTGSTEAGITQVESDEYYVAVTDAYNCSASFSYSVSEAECSVQPESYFTPNGDGYNDTWDISNSAQFADARLIIFDRWGLAVYEYKGLYESWDGIGRLGIPLPDAVYYYFFYPDKDDKQKEAKCGSVTIIR